MVGPLASNDYVCTTCHSPCSRAGGAGVVLGSALLLVALLMALTTRDGVTALAATPVALAGVAAAVRSRTGCSVCGSEAIVPKSTPRGQALLPEGLRDGQAAP